MPKLAGKQTRSRSGASGKLVAVVLAVLVLAGAAVGGYFWNRAAAARVAEAYARACDALFTKGRFDTAALKTILCRRDAAKLAASQADPRWMSRWDSWWALGGGEAPFTSSFEVKEVSAGVSRAAVDVRVNISVDGMAMSKTQTIHLVREGVAWKVDAQKSEGGGSAAIGLRDDVDSGDTQGQ